MSRTAIIAISSARHFFSYRKLGSSIKIRNIAATYSCFCTNITCDVWAIACDWTLLCWFIDATFFGPECHHMVRRSCNSSSLNTWPPTTAKTYGAFVFNQTIKVKVTYYITAFSFLFLIPLVTMLTFLNLFKPYLSGVRCWSVKANYSNQIAFFFFFFLFSRQSPVNVDGYVCSEFDISIFLQ